MKQRSPLRNAAEYALVVAALKTIQWAPLALAKRLARGYMSLLDLAVPKLRRTAYRNLAMALPDANPRAITDEVFDSLGRVLLAFAKFPSIRQNQIPRWIRCEGIEHFERALAQGRGVLIPTAHFGNWELSAFAHALITGPMNIVVRPLDNPLLDNLFRKRRELSGNRSIAKGGTARQILKALARNEAVGMLIDQNWSNHTGLFTNFFGVPACSDTGFAKLAARSGAAVIPGFALWSAKERRYVLRFHPPIPLTGDPAADTARLQTMLEEFIRDHPGQWLWLHRRWKTRPEGSPPLY